MKRLLLLSILSFFVLSFIQAQSPKREMRAAWVATVTRIDWPSIVVSATGNASQIATQQAAMTRILDSLAAANMNAIYFQVRSNCDAMYKSSYEPWSSDLVTTRGMDPGYDPLAFVVQEAHKRGIEVHAWLNPYRFEMSLNQWTGLSGDYKATHPDWVLTYSDGYAILDPGRPEVLQRIKDIIGEIVHNYNVDGVVFDDYFYHYGGTPATLDAASQALYKPASMNVDDWRRDNVNRMVASVYDTIQKMKPWVTFGISPFGLWTTNSSVAAANGLTLPAIPSGYSREDAYSDIYCDAVAWLKQGTVDYISPQLYWTIGSPQPYEVVCPWWSNIVNQFGKQFYSSQYTSGFAASEIGSEIAINRSSDKNGAPGSVLFSMKPMMATGYLASLRTNYFTNKSLTPAINWKTHPAYGTVSGLALTGNSLSWNAADTIVRYSVYAIPTSQLSQGNVYTATHLLGVSYSNSFVVPASLVSGGYTFAVAVLDRYGNEFTPVLLGQTNALGTPVDLTYPADQAKVFMPFAFKWTAQSGADSYYIEVAKDAAFTNVMYATELTVDSLSSANIGAMIPDSTYYWRVTVRKAGYNDTVLFSAMGHPKLFLV